MNHVLVFGGTGMLVGASEWLIANARNTVVFGRNEQRLSRLNPGGEEVGFHAKVLDYQDTEALRTAVRTSIQQHGAIDIVVSWIHGSAPDAIPAIFDEISRNQTDQWRFVHIKGSSYHLRSIQSRISVPNNCLYRDVQLGFKLEGHFSRWLTHNEISNGVIDAIKRDAEKTVIGTLEPWDKRP